MNKRGKIIRDTSVGQGLLSIGGQQYPFDLEGVWKSDVAPTINMVVEVELDGNDKITSIHTVPDSQLAKEQAAVAVSAAKEKGAQIASGLLAKFGVETLVAMAVLVLGWFAFNTVSVQVSSAYSLGFSFWKVLAVVNSPMGIMNAGAAGGGTGIYGFLAIVALVAPLAPYFWKDHRAYLGGLLPLLFVLFVGAMIYLGINDGIKQAQGVANMFGGQRMAEELTSGMAKEVLKAITIGIGGYLSIVASLYFAAKGTIKFLAAKA